MRLRYLAPSPDAPTGVAQYAATLERYLGRYLDLDGGAPSTLYQIGNNNLHWGIYQEALTNPGAVLLHDACLHHLLLGNLSREEYVEEFVFNYGEWFRQTAETYWNGRSNSAADSRYFSRPLLKRLCERSKLVLVHNPAAAAAVQSHAPQAEVLEIPHLFEPPREFSYREIDVYREQVLGVPRSECLFAVLGHLRESKRIETVLSAFASLRKAGLPIRLLVQGRFVGSELELALERQMRADWIVRQGYLEEEEWWLQAHAIDAAINLRWPLAGESSGIATRLMGIGRPVILTRSRETEGIPDAAAIRIDPGLSEREQLEYFVSWLTLTPEARYSMGRHAALHIRQFHGVDRVAGLLADRLTKLFDGNPT